MEPVRSHRNRKVVEAARLHRARDRHREGRTLLEGPNLLSEALSAGVVPEMIFALAGDEETKRLARSHGAELTLVDPAGLGRLAGTKTPRGPVAVISIPGPRRSDDAVGLLVAWGVSDPGNVGTLIRTAAGLGWDFAHTETSCDPWSPKTLRAASGGHFHTGIEHVGSVSDISALGFSPVASVVSGGVDPVSMPAGRYALLVGEEGAGLPLEVVGAAAWKVTIPMAAGTQSLNAAVAAGILLYELSKARRVKGGQV
jgi:TrmH family RNA methyltransferase